MSQKIIDYLKEVKELTEKYKKTDWTQMLDECPTVEDLDLPVGSVVLIRGDLDSKKKVDADKLDPQKQTLDYCVNQGWKVILMGHRNRPTPEDQKGFFAREEIDPTFYFEPEIRKYLGSLIGKELKYVRNWLAQDGSEFTAEFYQAVEKMQNGEILLLENERLWDFLWNELWEAEDDETLTKLNAKYEKLAKELVEKVGVKAHINDAASDAKNVNFSTVAILPYVKKAALGFHFVTDLTKIKEARKAKLVCFSGAKLDKVKKIKKIVKRGYVDQMIVGGLVALPFIKAKAKLAGQEVSLGNVAKPEMEQADRERYVSPEIVGQAEEMYQLIKDKGLKINIVTPVDFKLDNGEITQDVNIPDDREQWDIGPKSMEQIRLVTADYLRQHQNDPEKPTVFINGFLGRKEVPGFAAGTDAWAEEVQKLATAGFKIIAGGGEGRQVYAGAEVIISGGTTLEGMGTGSIPALKAVWLKAKGEI